MYNIYRSGIADTPREFQKIADHAADMPLGYGPAHRDWAYGKLLSRMNAGVVAPCIALSEDNIAAVTVAYPEVPLSDDPHALHGVEIKLWRTVPEYRSWGLGRLTMKGAVNGALQMMGVSAGTPVRLHLDTRDPHSATAFAAMGFIEVGQELLYETEDTTELPQQPDRLFEKIIIAPENLQAAG